MSDHHHSPVLYYKVFAALIALTLLTVITAYMNLGALGLPVALGIAITKGTLVILFFMHLKEAGGLVKLSLISGFVWLLILMGITLCDYAARDWSLRYKPRDSWITQSPSHFTSKTTHVNTTKPEGHHG